MGEPRTGERWAFLAGLLVLVALAPGCASDPSKPGEPELMRIDQWFPGHYSNAAQVAADLSAGRAPHEAVLLEVIPLDAPLIGLHAFYLVEKRADGSGRILSQRLVRFALVKRKHLVKLEESLWSFTEPERWREGDLTPELFTSLQPPDVKPLRGCELTWTRAGERFTATDDREHCSHLSERTGAIVSIDTRIELSPDELAVSEREIDAHGATVGREPADPYLRFHHVGS
ncbi:MAG TPA: CpcT/CpeT family chromophore lyase [Steroidobacteraceae bacterium]|nr:CpcT/CpeT family chromophore lyase [Steroidobacteraceae bacterium]